MKKLLFIILILSIFCSPLLANEDQTKADTMAEIQQMKESIKVLSQNLEAMQKKLEEAEERLKQQEKKTAQPVQAPAYPSQWNSHEVCPKTVNTSQSP